MKGTDAGRAERHGLFDWRNAVALLIGCVFAALLGEVACRVLDLGSMEGAEPDEERTVDKGVPWAYEPGSRLVYVYPDNPRGYFDENNTVTGTVNSFGFRGRETTMVPDPGTSRIAFLGDSFTLGVGVRDEHTLPALVEKELHPDVAGIEVLNFGASGSAPTYQIELFRERVLEFHPDVVVEVLFLNDAGSIPTMQFISRPWFFRRIRRHSYLANAIMSRLERGTLTRRMIDVYNHDFEDSSPGYQELKTAVAEGANLARSNGIQFVVAVYPVLFHVGDDYPFEGIHRKLGELCRSLGIPFIDLQPAFRGQLDQELWVHATDQHPNEVANRLAAARLADELRSLGIIDRLRTREAGHERP